jgi:hypothetical protein
MKGKQWTESPRKVFLAGVAKTGGFWAKSLIISWLRTTSLITGRFRTWNHLRTGGLWT